VGVVVHPIMMAPAILPVTEGQAVAVPVLLNLLLEDKQVRAAMAEVRAAPVRPGREIMVRGVSGHGIPAAAAVPEVRVLPILDMEELEFSVL
jgi:hypothetical protein